MLYGVSYRWRWKLAPPAAHQYSIRTQRIEFDCALVIFSFRIRRFTGVDQGVREVDEKVGVLRVARLRLGESLQALIETAGIEAAGRARGTRAHHRDRFRANALRAARLPSSSSGSPRASKTHSSRMSGQPVNRGHEIGHVLSPILNDRRARRMLANRGSKLSLPAQIGWYELAF